MLILALDGLAMRNVYLITKIFKVIGCAQTRFLGAVFGAFACDVSLVFAPDAARKLQQSLRCGMFDHDV